MIDSRAIFVFFRDPKTPDRPVDPFDKKEVCKIDSFKGNFNKNMEFEKCSTESSVLAGVLGLKKSKFYGTFNSCFPFTSIIRDDLAKSSILSGFSGRKMGKFYGTSDFRCPFT